VAEVAPSSHVGGDLETLKQELLTEMRQELQKVKDEIIQGLNRNYTIACRLFTGVCLLSQYRDVYTTGHSVHCVDGP